MVYPYNGMSYYNENKQITITHNDVNKHQLYSWAKEDRHKRTIPLFPLYKVHIKFKTGKTDSIEVLQMVTFGEGTWKSLQEF